MSSSSPFQKVRIAGLAAALATLAVPASLSRAAPSGDEFRKWETATPAFAKDAATWRRLLVELDERGMSYGAVAASSRMLTFFNDLSTKEAAYRGLIGAIDLGIPLSPREQFITGDLEPRGDYSFANSYYLYKALVNQARGLARWAENHFSRVDRESFPKYLFFQAVEAYSGGNRAKAKEFLEKILAKADPSLPTPLLRKTARTLARILYEEKSFARSLEIYTTFLLRMNPVEPNDWVEAAWNLFHLKRHDQALGMLYNSESRAASGRVNLEKYMIRALIYRENCDSERMGKLTETFDRDFGQEIRLVKTGESLPKIPGILRVLPKNPQGFTETLTEYEGLRAEYDSLGDLPSSVRQVADYLYRSQLTLARARYDREVEEASTEAARRIVMLGEHLRFLRFDVEKAKFDPAAVFTTVDPFDAPLVSSIGDSKFRISWPQVGDYWREERLTYLGKIVDRCGTR